MSITKFLRKLEGKPETPTVKESGLSEVTHVHIIYLEEVLDGDFESLDMAFRWRTTPQGYDYWGERCDGLVGLSEDDYAYLRALLDHHTTAT